MKNGLSFNGIHSSAFDGVTVKTRDRPVMPAPKLSSYEADNMNGDIDFTGYTGMTYYQNRTVSIDFQIAADDLRDLQNRMNNLMLWLRGKGEIIFDDMPYVKWIGRVSDSVSYMPEYGQSAVLSVSFLCEPFTRYIYDASERSGVQLGDYITLGAHIMLGAQISITLAANTATSLYIIGDIPVRPIITKTATGSWTVTVSNSYGSQTFSCTETAKMTADGVKQQLYNGTTNYLPYMTGDFPYIMPREENVITSSVAATVTYTPMFFYNGGMS